MKIINIILLTVLAVCLFIQCDSDSIGETVYSGQAYVRFNAILGKDDAILEADDNMLGNVSAAEEYTHSSLFPVKIPVALTYPNLDKEIEVKYSVDGPDEDFYTISPAETLNFNSNSLTDTIVVTFSDRWTSEDEFHFYFALESVSDDNIHIGTLNDSIANNTLDVTLGEVNGTFTFSDNLLEISGTEGEQTEFYVNFENGFIPEEIEGESLFSETPGFDYTLEQIIEDSNYESVKYILTLNESIDNDDVSYKSTFSLNEGLMYEATGNTSLQITKPIKVDRDVSTNPAAYFYDLSDTYHKTYGENWIYSSGDDACAWQSWNAYSYPVEVDKDDDGAILYSDNETDDESDDIYYHAFRFGFNTIVESNTVNSFNLKRWFNNESTSSSISPGLNITSALEFYPEDGTSTTNGTVQVISQSIVIGNKDGDQYTIEISGEGTYELVDEDLMEISLTFVATNEELFGGSRISYYKIYNSNNYGGDPEDIESDCYDAIDL